MIPRRKQELWDALSSVAPGTNLREGLDRISKARMGALIVVGDGPDVLNVCSGGFLLDAAFTPQRLSELAKMDGAIILSSDSSRIARANVHLVPNPNVPTTETGTRHRTAERVARSVGVPVATVSEDMAVLTVYRGDEKYQLESIPNILNRCDQALQTLERYKSRLNEELASLTAHEVEGLVTLRDVIVVLQRSEMVSRIADELRHHLIELGADGRLVRLQLLEMMAGVGDEQTYVVRDYAPDHMKPDEALARLSELDPGEVTDPDDVGDVLGLSGELLDLDQSMQPRGYRILGRILPRLPEPVIEAVVGHCGRFDKLMRASTEELSRVDGVTEQLAAVIRDGLSQQAESSILTRYQ
ncbi:MAG: DNA integrity scanning diadenylate cyclase DisA [Microthrixaceae bacterium]